MKKRLYAFGILAALVLALAFTACDSGGGDGGPIVLSGTLSHSGQSAPANRSPGAKRADTPTRSQTFRAEIGSDNSIKGKLKDGSVIFELTGIYDPDAKAFSMQAPSNFIIFTIAGKLTAAGALDTDATTASIKVKDDNNEWTSIDCDLTVGSQTVDGAINAKRDAVTSLPASWRKTWTDQVSALIGANLRYIITSNSITMLDEDRPPQDFTVVEVTNSNSNAGPWDLIISAKYYNDSGNDFVNYIGKFYVSLTFDSKIDTAIGSQKVNDICWGYGDEYGNESLTDAFDQLLGADTKACVTAYATTATPPQEVSDKNAANWLHPNPAALGNFSPFFETDAAARVATDLKAFSGFTLFLK